MKGLYVLVLIFVIVSSCSVSRKTNQYFSNDDNCFCGIDSVSPKNEEIIDVSLLDFIDTTITMVDTLQNSKDFLKVLTYEPNKIFAFSILNKRSNVGVEKVYWADGMVKEKSSFLIIKGPDYLPIGYSFAIDQSGMMKWEVNDNYIIYGEDINEVNVVAEKFPICWKEALNLVQAKIGKFTIERMYRNVQEIPNPQGMHYYWTIKAKKRWGKSKHYRVDAVTGKIVKVNIEVVIDPNDMLD